MEVIKLIKKYRKKVFNKLSKDKKILKIKDQINISIQKFKELHTD